MNFTEDPQNEYYYYDGGEEYGDVYYDNEEYKETYNYEDASEGKKYLNPKRCGLFWVVFREVWEMKFAYLNFLSKEDLNISYENWDVELTFDTLINASRFKS